MSPKKLSKNDSLVLPSVQKFGSHSFCGGILVAFHFDLIIPITFFEEETKAHLFCVGGLWADNHIEQYKTLYTFFSMAYNPSKAGGSALKTWAAPASIKK